MPKHAYAGPHLARSPHAISHGGSMASIKKHGEKWRAQVDKQGVRRSKVCRKKAEIKPNTG